ncbi:acyl-CoA dehydrogenase [Nocardia sp. GAS34]|uniref:acyl-CoA dehydrogenase family protein n=1 Tax=unclassified Nocardia TaxID=2637762 RepID=UPI003D21804B
MTTILFGDDHERAHGPWRRLAAQECAHRWHDLNPDEAVMHAYSRLRDLDGTPNFTALTDNSAQIANLHEWLMPIAPTLAIIAGIHYNLFLGSLVDHGADVTGVGGRDGAVGTFLVTELDHGNDVSALETVATYDRARDGFIVRTPCAGAQKFMPNTSPVGGPKVAVVAARLIVDGTDQGVFLFRVPLTTTTECIPGVRVRVLPFRSGPPVDHSLTSFDDVFVSRDALLAGPHGRFAADGTFISEIANPARRVLRSIRRVTPGKLSMNAVSLGITRAGLAIAVRHGKQRWISGTGPVGRISVLALRSHHGPLLSGIADAYAMTVLHRYLVGQWSSHRDTAYDRTEWLLAVGKGWITWRAREILADCRERCGSQGLFPTNRLAEYMACAELPITAEGDNQAIWVKAAAHMVRAHPAAADPRPEPGHEYTITDPAHLVLLFAAAENIWLDRAREATQRAAADNPLAYQNALIDPALQAVRACAGRIAAQAMFLQLQHLSEDSPTGALFGDLYRLHTLRGLMPYLADLLRCGYVSADSIEQIPAAVDAALTRLLPHIDTLTSAFTVPEELLGQVPVATDDPLAFFDDHEGPWAPGTSTRRTHTTPSMNVPVAQ